MTDYETPDITRREALKGGSAAAVAAGAYLMQQQLVQAASAQSTNEPRIQLGGDYAIDDDPDGNGDFVITHQPSGAEFRYNSTQDQWEFGDLSISNLSRSVVGASAYKSGSRQTVTSGTRTKITLEATAFDHNNFFDLSNNRFVTDESGIYQVSGAVLWRNSVPDGTRLITNIYVNGNVSKEQSTIIGASDYAGVGVSGAVEVGANEAIELYGRQDSGSDQDVQFGEKNTWITVVKIG